MRTFSAMFLCVLLVFTGASAATLDFSSGVPVFPDPPAFSFTVNGVTFDFAPINNLVGTPRWIHAPDGIRFGGGSGSSLSFEFTPDTDVTLDSYEISTSGLLGNPDFDILDGLMVVSGPNDANVGGSNSFQGAPVALDANTTYTFEVNTSGAAIQSAFSAWEFTVVPEPGALSLVLGLCMLLCGVHRRSLRATRK